MNRLAASEAPTVLTPRLVFKDDDDIIPAFLRKERPDAQPVTIQEEPKEAPMMEEPANENITEISENVELLDAPAQVSTEIVNPVAEAEAMDADPGSKDGSTSLDDMTVEDLQRQQAEIDRKIQEKREAEKRSVIDQIVSVVNTYKIPVEELVEALGGLKVKRKGVKAKPKYQDPKSGAIWSGRGKEPVWIKGKNRAPFEIK